MLKVGHGILEKAAAEVVDKPVTNMVAASCCNNTWCQSGAMRAAMDNVQQWTKCPRAKHFSATHTDVARPHVIFATIMHTSWFLQPPPASSGVLWAPIHGLYLPSCLP